MDNIREAIIERSVEKKGRQSLPCAAAFKIAEDTGADLQTIGKLCNEENIRICNCQLGCF